VKLLVGLGNPGIKYQLNRHNVGFLLIDALADKWGNRSQFKSEHQALTQKVTIDNEPCLLAKPQTYMNLSGESVRALMNYYDISRSDLLIMQDEVDIPYSTLRFHVRRGHGGHNGIRNIHEHLGTNDYARLKLGVGRPIHPQMEVADFVLQNFSSEEQTTLPEFLTQAMEATEFFVKMGVEKAANQYNGPKG